MPQFKQRYSQSIYRHKIGATFTFAGRMEKSHENEPDFDFTGWSGRAQIKRVDDQTVISDANFQWLDQVEGNCRITVPEGTDDWPVCRAALNVELITPDDEVIPADTLIMMIDQEGVVG